MRFIKQYFLSLVIFILLDSINGQIIHLSLDAQAKDGIWTASGSPENGEPNGTIQVPASVPGGIYSDLENSGIFSTPIYYRYNDKETQWVGRTNWTFSRTFEVNETLMNKTNVVMICDGLDTVASVFLNNELIGKSDNMFMKYVYNAKPSLQIGLNHIRIEFESPVIYAKKQWDLQSQNYPVPPSCVPPEYQGECHANHLRKMQASFSWDWGPSYPSSGIWKSIYLEGFNGAFVMRDMMVFITPNQEIPDETTATTWNVTARVWHDHVGQVSGVDVDDNGELSLELPLPDSDQDSVVEKRLVSFENGLGQNSNWTDITFFISGSLVKMWWPNGYGSQKLYNITVSYKSFKYHESSQISRRVGFRVVKLIEDPIDNGNLTKGLSFYFRVNGVPIYAKGSNSIPLHVLPERVTPKMTKWLFDSAKESNMNMIRVWGGGIYEHGLFYDLADSYGIMIWEDFMFACAMYPTTPEFLGSVRKEVETQVKRLQFHPSIVIWAANNENEAALRGNWYGTANNFSTYAKDYVQLYVDTIRAYVHELDPSRACLTSSPTNGKGSDAEGHIAKNPYSLIYGDVHFYDYKSDGWNWKVFPRTRFASEYGYQSWPHLETLKTSTDPELDWTWNSSMIYHRQHHPGGQEEILAQIKQHFPLPPEVNSTLAFPKLLYMAQITQAMSVKTQTEFYRRFKGHLYENGEGQNMGALYWQLNDIWEGASWASIEINGRWKMLHYFARDFFAPVLISPYQTDDHGVGIDLVSDLTSGFNGTLSIRLFTLDSTTPVFHKLVNISAPPLSATEVYVIPRTELEMCENSVSICFIYLSMPGAPDNFLFLGYPNNTSVIPNPSLKVDKVTGGGTSFQVHLSSTGLAPFVFLNLQNNNATHGWFSQNGFILIESPKVITYESQDHLSLAQFQAQLQVLSLHDAT